MITMKQIVQSLAWATLACALPVCADRVLPDGLTEVASGLVSRTLDMRGGHVLGQSYKLADGTDFMQEGSPEFAFRVDGRMYTGWSVWKDVKVGAGEARHGARTVTVVGVSADGKVGIELVYATYPGLALIRKTLAVTNKGDKDVAIEDVDVETFLMDFGIAKHAEGNWLSNVRSGDDGRIYVRNLAWGRTPALPATSLVIGNLHMNGDNHLLSFKALAGTLPIMLGDPRTLTASEKAEYREWASWLKGLEARHSYMSFRQDLPGFGEPQEGAWDGFARINTETRSGGLVGVFRHNAAERSRRIAVRGLDPVAKYAILKGAKGERVAEMSGTELELDGFKVEFSNRIDGELFEITKIGKDRQ